MLLLLLLLLLGCCSGAAAWQTLTINVATAVPANRTIQAETSLLFTNGGQFVVAAGATLVIEGSLESAPLQQIFSGPGTVLLGTRVPQVHPEWFGASVAPVAPSSMRRRDSWRARHDDSRTSRAASAGAPSVGSALPAASDVSARDDDTAAIQRSIDALMFGGKVVFSPGQYTLRGGGLSVGSSTNLVGPSAGASMLFYADAAGSAITLRPDTEWFSLENLALRGSRVDGCGINGSAHYVRYFNARDFEVIGFKKGIFISAGEHIHLGFGYMSSYRTNGTVLKGAPGTVALQLGAGGGHDWNGVDGCTTVTVENIYFTTADILIYTISAPQVIIRPIFEECRVGIQSYSRGIVIGPFSDNPSCDVIANLTNNGMYFLGFPEGQHPVHFAGSSERDRSSFMPDTFDGPMRLGSLSLAEKLTDHTLTNFTLDNKPV